MRKSRKWVMTLGLMATAPGVTLAGPFDFLKPRSPARQSPAATRPDNQQVAEHIADALRKARLNGSDIEINFQGGVARISGKVQDADHKARATQLVARVPGVQRVDNQLTVNAPAGAPLVANPFTAPAIMPAGGDMPQVSPEHGVQSAEATNPFGSAAPAPSEPQPTSPAEPAGPASPAGPARPSNQEMAQEIAKALKKERLSGYDIQIRFRNGTALLAGSVKNADQRARAEKAAADVSGVEHVANQLIVPGQPQGNWMAAQQQAAGARPGQPPIHPVAYQPLPPNGDAAPPGPLPMHGGMPPGGMAMPVAGGPAAGMIYGHPGAGTAHQIYNMPHMPEYAWPSTAQYPNSAGVQYPTQYSASAWPYIGPFYPYPQVPLGWRQAQLEWDDGHWHLNFRPRTERWWWFMHPKNW